MAQPLPFLPEERGRLLVLSLSIFLAAAQDRPFPSLLGRRLPPPHASPGVSPGPRNHSVTRPALSGPSSVLLSAHVLVTCFILQCVLQKANSPSL